MKKIKIWHIVVTLIICPLIVGIILKFVPDGKKTEGNTNSVFVKSNHETVDKSASTSIANSTFRQEVSSITLGDIENNSNTQVNINSPNSSQIINQKKFFSEAIFEKEKNDNRYITRITLIQTEGIWSSGVKFWIQVFLSGPYEKYNFVQGLPVVQMMTITRDDKKKGIIDFSMESAPLDKPIVLEIESNNALDIESFHVEPISNGRIKVKNL